jgi:hypothetical protein
MAESLLDALEGSLRLFEKHRIFLLSCSAANNGQQGKSPGSEAGARLGFVCVTGVTVTNRTVMDARSLHNRAISEIRWL